MSPIIFVPTQTHSHQGPRVGALGGNVKKEFPKKRIPQEPSLGIEGMGTMIPPKKEGVPKVI